MRNINQVKLRDVASRVSVRNSGGNTNVLTISATHGLVSQEEYFNRRVASADLSQYYLLREGDFAYNKSYSAGWPVGVVRPLERYREGVVSPLYICFRPDPQHVNPSYLQHYFDSGALDEVILLIAKEGARNHGLLNVGIEDFFDLPLKLPSLQEQQRIAEVLNEIGHNKRHHQRVTSKLTSLRSDLIRHATSNNGDRQQSTLDELTTVIVDGVHHTPTYRESGVPFVTVENLTRGTGISMDPVRYISEEDHAEFSRRTEPSAGDILVSKDGTLGVARVVPEHLKKFSIFVSVALIRTDPHLLDPRYGCMFFESPQFFTQLRKLSSGTGLNHIHLQDFRKFLLSVPDIPTQKAWSVKLAAANEAINKEQEALRKVDKIGRSLMRDLFSEHTHIPTTPKPIIV
ncbi:restriction endonuclease subunit S [Streptomyces sp. NPDC051561]|uniref:restriction endonuclease subunit S n=1 Tax=Streptomyces sp. NPDC051561 TaxID=3365658 RepID=UPI00378BB639